MRKGLTPRQAKDEFKCLARNNLMNQQRIDQFGNTRVKVGESTVNKSFKKLGITKRKREKCNTVLRDLHASCPRAAVRNFFVYEAIRIMHGAPVQKSKVVLFDIGSASFAEEELKTDQEVVRVLRPEHLWNYDESNLNTFKNLRYVIGNSRQKHDVSPALKAYPMSQSLPVIFGCNGAGQKLAVLVGAKTKRISKGSPHIIPLPAFQCLSVGPAVPLVVLCHPDDVKSLPKIFEKRILQPTMEWSKAFLVEGESNIVFKDGGCREHLKDIYYQDHYLEEHIENRVVSSKLHAQLTQKSQICDLLPIFKALHAPDAQISKLTAAQYEAWLQEMIQLLEPHMKPYFENGKRLLMIESITLLFRVIVPGLDQLRIQNEWSKLGVFPLSLEQMIERIHGVVSTTYLAQVRLGWDEFVRSVIEWGRLKDEIMNKYLPPGVFDLDGKKLRNDGMILLTHEKTRERALEELERPKRQAEEKEQKRKEREENKKAKEKEKEDKARERKEAKEQKVEADRRERECKAKAEYDVIVDKKNKEQCLTVIQTQKAILYESMTVTTLQGDDCRCKWCPLVFSVMQKWTAVDIKRKAWTGEMTSCDFCDEWICNLRRTKIDHSKKNFSDRAARWRSEF